MSALYNGDQGKSYESLILKAALNGFKAFGFQQLTLSGSAQNLTIPTGAKYALIVVESSLTTIAGRYLEFGGTVTPVVATSVGIPIKDGTVFDVTDAQNLAGFQVIQEAAGTHKLNIQYYK